MLAVAAAGCTGPLPPSEPIVTPNIPTPVPARSGTATTAPSVVATDRGPDALTLLADLGAIALQSEDLAELGGAFEAFDVGETSLIDSLPPPQSARDRFGRLGGWKARYRQSPQITTGILVVDSRIDLFPDAGAAASDVNAYVQRYTAQASTAGVPTASPPIGDATITLAIVPSDIAQVRSAMIAWRHGPFTGQVVVSGLGNVDPAAAVKMLAEAVDQRMTDAVEGN
jgi:hypothetical protein